VKIIFLFLVSSVLFIACENNVEEVNHVTFEDEKKLPVESAKNVEMFYSDSAIVRAKLKSPQVDRYVGKSNYMLLPKGMNIVFYDANKEEETNLKADFGIGYEGNGGMTKMEAKRNVEVINKKGEKLNSEHLIWDAVKKQIYTNAFVKITTSDKVLWGDGLVANEDFSEYEITNIKGQVAVADEK